MRTYMDGVTALGSSTNLWSGERVVVRTKRIVASRKSASQFMPAVRIRYCTGSGMYAASRA
jgi:hypothetical protein